MTSEKRHCSYIFAEKLKVVGFAKERGNRSAGRKFDIPESSERKWWKDRNNTLIANKKAQLSQ